MAYAFDTPLITTDQSIDRVLAAGLPVALVFLNGEPQADLDDTLRRLAKAHAGKLLVVKVNPQDSPGVAQRFQVAGTPAVVAVRGGQAVSQAQGVSAKDLEAHVAYLIGGGPRPGPAQAQPQGGGRPLKVTDGTFDEMVLRSPEPVLVDFWAPWCGPCRMIEPAVENLARDTAGRMRVAKVNVDENPAVASRYEVHGIPTMMVVKGGKIVERWSGALPEPALRSRALRWVGV